MTNIYNEKIPLTQEPPKQKAIRNIDTELKNLFTEYPTLRDPKMHSLQIALPLLSEYYDCNFCVIETGRRSLIDQT